MVTVRYLIKIQILKNFQNFKIVNVKLLNHDNQLQIHLFIQQATVNHLFFINIWYIPSLGEKVNCHGPQMQSFYINIFFWHRILRSQSRGFHTSRADKLIKSIALEVTGIKWHIGVFLLKSFQSQRFR